MTFWITKVQPADTAHKALLEIYSKLFEEPDIQTDQFWSEQASSFISGIKACVEFEETQNSNTADNQK